MSDFPNCPQCGGSLVYSDGTQLVCPECAHEWMPGEAPASDGPVVRDVNGNALAQGDTVVVIKDLKVKGSSIPLKQQSIGRSWFSTPVFNFDPRSAVAENCPFVNPYTPLFSMM